MIATAHRPRHPILSTLLITLSCWAHLAFADLECVSLDPIPSSLPPNHEFALGFKDNGPFFGGTIKALLMCSSGSGTAKSVLVLGQDYGKKDFSPNSPTTFITRPQATRALANCPGNSFFLQYEHAYRSFPLLRPTVRQAPCANNFGLEVAPPASTPVPPPTASTHMASQTSSATSYIAPTNTATGTLSLSASYTLLTPSPSTHPGDNGSIGGGTITPMDPTPTGPNTPSDMKGGNSPSPSIGLITGASVGVVAGIFAILAVILVWRKRQQTKARIDHLVNGSLMASSGFQNDKPIYGRSDPDDDHSATHPPAAMDAIVVPMNHEHSSQQYRHARPRPGYTQNNQPLPQLSQAAPHYQHHRQHQHQQQQQQQQQQHAGPYHEYNDQEYFHKEELPPQRQPSYRLPYSQPANDYNYPRRHQGMQ